MNEKCVKSVDNGACLSSLMLADHLDSCCECCRELLNAEGIEISDEATKMFKILLGFDLSSGFICCDCNCKLSDCTSFVTRINERHKAKLISKQPPTIDPFASLDFISDDKLEELEYEPIAFTKEAEEFRLLEPVSFTLTTESAATTHCFDCDISLPLTELLAHRLTYHSPNFFCDLCNQIYHSKLNLQKHLQQHMARLNEPSCGKDTSNTLRNKSNGNHLCEFCSKPYKDKFQLKMHVRRHTGEKNFQCDSCGRFFASKKALWGHSKINHQQRKPLQCTICWKRIMTTSKLNLHMQKTHPAGDSDVRVNEETNRYHCQRCNLGFDQMTKYERHVSSKYLCCELIKANKTSDEFMCKVCKAILKTVKGLRKHVRYVHPTAPSICRICSKQLKNPHTLWQHMTLSHKQQKRPETIQLRNIAFKIP